MNTSKKVFSHCNSFVYHFSFFLYKQVIIIEIISTQFDDTSLTAEDMMATSALAVSPILTASLFDELYNNNIIDNSNITDLAINENPMIYRHRRHRIRRLPPPTTTILPPPPPSARWRERLSSLQSASDRTNAINDENDEDYEEFTDGDVAEYDHIGPVSLPSIESFPRRSVTAHFVYGQNCLNGRAYNISPLLSGSENMVNGMLDFDVISDDGGQYG
jgi:hypothetical protein